VQNKHSASPSLMSSLSNSIFISDSLDDSCTLTLPFVGDLLRLVPDSLFIVGFFDSSYGSVRPRKSFLFLTLP
jgi:hypothetical protein